MKKIIALSLFAFVTACSQTPRRTLTVEEKAADFAWLFSQFGENYAPMEYKESRNGFKYEELKAKFLERSAASTSNEEFYGLMNEFVANFKDAHTSGMFLNSTLPGLMEVAYLGFSGERVGNNFVVKKFLPTFATTNSYPIKVGAVITAIDGVALVDLAKGELAKYRNLGQDEATITYNMSKIFNRIASSSPMPTSEFAVLTLYKGEKPSADGKTTEKITENVIVPWVRKDYYQFLSEQRTAVLKKRSETSTAAPQALDSDLFTLGFSAASGQYSVIPSFFKALDRNQKGFNFLKTFAFIDTAPIWSSKSLERWLMESQYGKEAMRAQILAGKSAAETEEEFFKNYYWTEMTKERNLPTQYIRVQEAYTYPAYVTPVTLKTADGKPSGYKKYVGYIYLDTFSPGESDEVTVKSLNATFTKFKELGVKDVIVDLINNGGGSLVLGSKLAQAFSATKIVLPEMQFKLSDSWINEFVNTSLSGDTDPERELARKMGDILLSDRAKGLKISRGINSEVIMPWEINGNVTTLETGGFNTVLLVNEMCASMCDIFSGIMKDNHLATIVGVNTMGAGGNVVMHMSAPNSGFIVNQTESLIVRKDGSYIENNGVAPDVIFDTISDSAKKYDGARAKALELLAQEKITL